MPEAVIRAEQLTRRFGALTALQSLDLTVEAGEALAIFGPNGAGKSTFLRLSAMLLRPSAGRIALFGIDLGSGQTRLRRRLGVLSHQSFLYPDLSTAENLLFYARMFGVDDAAARVDASIDRVGLRGWAHRPVRTLSRGLEQRAALARALVHRPDVVLLDEPFTGLDLDATETIEALLLAERARGVTLVMTTHDLARGFALCDRAVVLVRGRVRWSGGIAPAGRHEFERRYTEIIRGERLAPVASAD